MKKSELLELLKDIPDDTTICVGDSYGAFSDYNHFNHSVHKCLVNVAGEKTWYWVVDTKGDEDGYKGNWEDKHVVEFPAFSEKALGFLKWKGYSPQYHTLKTPLYIWSPRIVGGTEDDREEVAKAADKYWNEVSEFLCIPIEILYDMTLGDLK